MTSIGLGADPSGKEPRRAIASPGLTADIRWFAGKQWSFGTTTFRAEACPSLRIQAVPGFGIESDHRTAPRSRSFFARTCCNQSESTDKPNAKTETAKSIQLVQAIRFFLPLLLSPSMVGTHAPQGRERHRRGVELLISQLRPGGTAVIA